MLLAGCVLFQLRIHEEGPNCNIHRSGFRRADEQLDRLRLTEAYNVGFRGSAAGNTQKHQHDESLNRTHLGEG
jgi:hypothetical protein